MPDVVIKEKMRAQESPLLQYRWPRAHMALRAPNSRWPLTSGTPMEPGAMTIFLGAGGGTTKGLWPRSSLSLRLWTCLRVEAEVTPLPSVTSDARSRLRLLPVPGQGLPAANGTHWTAGHIECLACQV